MPGPSEVTVTAAGTADKKGNLGYNAYLLASAILIGIICPDSNLYISGWCNIKMIYLYTLFLLNISRIYLCTWIYLLICLGSVSILLLFVIYEFEF